jgi:hypothetical protein
MGVSRAQMKHSVGFHEARWLPRAYAHTHVDIYYYLYSILDKSNSNTYLIYLVRLKYNSISKTF